MNAVMNVATTEAPRMNSTMQNNQYACAQARPIDDVTINNIATYITGLRP